MIIVINLFNQLFSHTAMAYISLIHHSVGTEAAEFKDRELQRVGEGGWVLFGCSCQVRSICCWSGVQNVLFFSLPGNKQRTCPLHLKAWLLCRTLRLSSITDLTSPDQDESDQTRCSSMCTHKHTQFLWFGNFKGPIWQGTPTYSQQDTCLQGVHTFACAAQPISQLFSSSRTHTRADAHTRTHAVDEVWLANNCRKGAQSRSDTPLFEIVAFLFKFTKIKTTTEINTLCLARNCGIVSTSCRSNEVTGGTEPKGSWEVSWGQSSRPLTCSLRLNILHLDVRRPSDSKSLPI